MEKGQPLAARCSEFDYAVQNLSQSASVPFIPVMAARYGLGNTEYSFAPSHITSLHPGV